MNTFSILKIETNNKIVLISKNATQEIVQEEHDIIRNINSQIISLNSSQKFKTIIETEDIPDFSLLKTNQIFKIYSIIDFVEYENNIPSIPYVHDSLISCKGYKSFIKFRPILEMYIINIKAKTMPSHKSYWQLVFESQ